MRKTGKERRRDRWGEKTISTPKLLTAHEFPRQRFDRPQRATPNNLANPLLAISPSAKASTAPSRDSEQEP